MVRPTQQQAQALYDLRGNTEAIGYVQACLDDVKQRLVHQSDPVALHVLQGQAQAYQDLLSRITTDPTTTSGKR